MSDISMGSAFQGALSIWAEALSMYIGLAKKQEPPLV